jgi:glutamate synthase domain-containing protein 2
MVPDFDMWALWTVLAALAVVVIYDLLQRQHAVLRNFPLIGHLRYWLEAFGPELRQYIVTDNDEERPFSRDERRWVYTSSKGRNNYFGFGTDNKIELARNYMIVRHSMFPLSDPRSGDEGYDPNYAVPSLKVLGGDRGRRQAFRPTSVVNISAMSFGSLSAAAVEALNRGALAAGCLQNTGEGGVAPHHGHGGELVWQIGTGYFGCRNAQGDFDLDRFRETIERYPVRAIEVKLSQGAKPGLGGVLPGAKVTREIAGIRGIPVGETCISPASHSAFSDVDSMLDFVEQLAEVSGLPVGIKSAVGELDFWHELARRMSEEDRGVDFITIDGGEGGTGAAPLMFTDHVALPFRLGFSEVRRIFCALGVDHKVVFIGSGKLGLPPSAVVAFAMGCDLVNVGREAMLAIGCIQAQRCHTGHCPTGVATQNRWLMRGLDPTQKSARLANYVTTLRKELLQVSRACGVEHPSLIGLERLELLDGVSGQRNAAEVFGLGGSRPAGG